MDFTCEGELVTKISSKDKTVLRSLYSIIVSQDYNNTCQHTAQHANEIDCIHRRAVLLKGKSRLNRYDIVRVLCHYYRKG